MKKFTPFKSQHRRRQGIAAVYIALMLIPLIGVTAFAIDISWLYNRRAVAQKAADAAALAGAYKYAHNSGANADGNARYYAGLPDNGDYDDGEGTEIVTIGKWDKTLADDQQVVEENNWYRVSVSRMEPTFFGGFFGKNFREYRVGATATALYESSAKIPIKGSGSYGVAPGPVNLALFGPNAWYNNGDRYSTKYIDNDMNKPNPDYKGWDASINKIPESQKGYSFLVDLTEFSAKGNSQAYLQIFDPDCFNVNNGVNAVAGTSIDEMRKTNGQAGTAADATTTKYKLWIDYDGEGNGAEVELKDASNKIVEKSYGSDSSTDMLWTDFYMGDISGLPEAATVRLQVVSTSGSSENGFDLRVDNKPVASKTIQDADRAKLALPANKNKTQAEQEALKNVANRFDSNNGSRIDAIGHIPINFNIDGLVSMNLGNIPKEGAGGNMTITNFDTDVQAGSAKNTVFYKCDPPAPGQPANGWKGDMSGNGQWEDYTIPLPPSYKGGNWTATYSAGAQDTSVWDMTYDGPGKDPSGKIRLVK